MLFNLLVIVKKILCFSCALEGEGERGAVTTSVIKENAAHSPEYVILKHLNLITWEHMQKISNTGYINAMSKVTEAICKITEAVV